MLLEQNNNTHIILFHYAMFFLPTLSKVIGHFDVIYNIRGKMKINKNYIYIYIYVLLVLRYKSYLFW